MNCLSCCLFKTICSVQYRGQVFPSPLGLFARIVARQAASQRWPCRAVASYLRWKICTGWDDEECAKKHSKICISAWHTAVKDLSWKNVFRGYTEWNSSESTPWRYSQSELMLLWTAGSCPVASCMDNKENGQDGSSIRNVKVPTFVDGQCVVEIEWASCKRTTLCLFPALTLHCVRFFHLVAARFQK